MLALAERAIPALERNVCSFIVQSVLNTRAKASREGSINAVEASS